MYPCAGTALASEEVYRTYQVHKGRKEMCVCGMLRSKNSYYTFNKHTN